jgi:hypothetical protein
MNTAKEVDGRGRGTFLGSSQEFSWRTEKNEDVPQSG